MGFKDKNLHAPWFCTVVVATMGNWHQIELSASFFICEVLKGGIGSVRGQFGPVVATEVSHQCQGLVVVADGLLISWPFIVKII